MAVFKAEERVMSGEYFVVRKGATALRNEVVYDPNLSYAAVGVLARALAAPPGAALGYRAFVGRGLGEKAVRGVLRELEKAGYRWQFKVQRPGGLIRTLTVFSDVAMSMEEAFQEVSATASGRIFECSTESARLRRWDRAAPVAARSDLGKHDPASAPVDNSLEEGDRAAPVAARCDLGKHPVSADRTVQRSTAARSSAALSLRENKISKEILTDQTSREEPPQAGGLPVGSGPVGETPENLRAPRGAPAATPEPDCSPGVDLRVLAMCLPEPMRVMDAQGARMVAGLLGERLGAGWRAEEIRSLMDQPLPVGGVGRMAALVARRLRDNVDAALAPGRLRSAAREAEAEKRVAPPRLEEPMPSVDPQWEAAWAWALQEHPEASKREQVAWAERRVAELRGGGGA